MITAALDAWVCPVQCPATSLRLKMFNEGNTTMRRKMMEDAKKAIEEIKTNREALLARAKAAKKIPEPKPTRDKTPPS